VKNGRYELLPMLLAQSLIKLKDECVEQSQHQTKLHS